jgi:hypothetical protein
VQSTIRPEIHVLKSASNTVVGLNELNVGERKIVASCVSELSKIVIPERELDDQPIVMPSDAVPPSID